VAVCYRHPDRETGVSCSSCGRPICPDCMTPTSVGMRCPECMKQKTKVRTARSLVADPYVTYALIAINVLVYVGSTIGGERVAGSGGGSVLLHGGLFGPAISQGHEYYRIVTSGFLHANVIHIGFNMYFLYVLGSLLEPAIGSGRFLIVYLVSLIGGSFGALLVTPDALTVGASGACFGVLGGAIALAMDRGIPIMQSGLGTTALINIAFSVAIPGISIGGHIGGLVTGFAVVYGLLAFGEGRGRAPLAYGAGVLLGAALFVAAIAVA
jgi:membrane associated rhomboid family serine protease